MGAIYKKYIIKYGNCRPYLDKEKKMIVSMIVVARQCVRLEAKVVSSNYMYKVFLITGYSCLISHNFRVLVL